MFTGDAMAKQIQVQLRVPEKTVKNIDKMISAGKFSSRSEAIKAMINAYEEREKTREFYSMLVGRSEEARKKPKELVPFSDL